MIKIEREILTSNKIAFYCTNIRALNLQTEKLPKTNKQTKKISNKRKTITQYPNDRCWASEKFTHRYHV